MMGSRLSWLFYLIILAAQMPLDAVAQESTVIADSAMNPEQPSPEKLALIREFMCVTGLQARLDSASHLERYALISELNWAENAEQASLFEDMPGKIGALEAAYARYRSIYQQEYERHINWEFTEEELRQIVAFMGSPVGEHYQDGSWRMNAYVTTNLEEVEQTLVEEAVATYRAERQQAQP